MKGEVDLEPCPNPWCVSTTAPVPVGLLAQRGYPAGWKVQCACGVQSWRQADKQEAIAAWNRRAPATAQSRPGEEALREALFKTAGTLRTLKAVCAEQMSMQGRQFIDLGIQVNNALDAAEAALSVSALPVPVGGEDLGSVGITSPTAKYSSPSLDSAREPSEGAE